MSIKHHLLIILALICLPYRHIYACDITPMFSPNGGIQEAIIREIDNENNEIFMAAYQFTDPAIHKALENQKAKGAIVRAVIDGKQRKQTAKYLGNPTYDIRFNSSYSIMHSKYLILGNTIITGSYNFTRSAEVRNAENIIIIKNCPEVVKAYKENWKKLWDEAAIEPIKEK